MSNRDVKETKSQPATTEHKKEFKSSDLKKISSIQKHIQNAKEEAKDYLDFYQSLHKKTKTPASKKIYETKMKLSDQRLKNLESLLKNLGSTKLEDIEKEFQKSHRTYHLKMGIINPQPSAQLWLTLLSPNPAHLAFSEFLTSQDMASLTAVNLFSRHQLKFKAEWNRIKELLKPTCWLSSLGEEDIQASVQKSQNELVAHLRKDQIVINPRRLLQRIHWLETIKKSTPAHRGLLTEDLCILLGENDKKIKEYIVKHINDLQDPLDKSSFITIPHCLAFNNKTKLLHDTLAELKHPLSRNFKTLMGLGDYNGDYPCEYAIASQDSFGMKYISELRGFFDYNIQYNDTKKWRFLFLSDRSTKLPFLWSVSKDNYFYSAIHSEHFHVLKWFVETYKPRVPNDFNIIGPIAQHANLEMVTLLFSKNYFKLEDLLEVTGSLCQNEQVMAILKFCGLKSNDSEKIYDLLSGIAREGSGKTLKEFVSEYKLSSVDDKLRMLSEALMGGNIDTLQTCIIELGCDPAFLNDDHLKQCAIHGGINTVLALQLLGVNDFSATQDTLRYLNDKEKLFDRLLQAYPESKFIPQKEIKSDVPLAKQVFNLLRDEKLSDQEKKLVGEFENFNGTSADLFYQLNNRLLDYMMQHKTPITDPFVIRMQQASHFVLHHIQQQHPLEKKEEKSITIGNK